MNKLTTIYVLFHTLLGCHPSQNDKSTSPGEVNVYDTNELASGTLKQSHIIEIRGTERTQPDTTINGKLFLENYSSAAKFYSKIEGITLVENLRSSPVMIFSNNDGTEYLMAYQYEGNTKNSFGCFEVGYVKDLDASVIKRINRSAEKSFQTESGISLGLSLDDVLKIKGSEFKKTEENSKMTLNYRINEFSKSAFLKRYNMPGYFIEIIFSDKKVVRLKLGFDYP